MGAIYNAITALYADQSLGDDSRKAQALALKVQGYIDNLQSRLPYVVTLDASRTLTVHRILLRRNRILLDVTFTKDGVVVAEHRAYWPGLAVLVPAKNGEVDLGTRGKYKEDVLAALLEQAKRDWV